jgi:acyl dehydratase
VAQTVVIDEERGLIIARHRIVNQRGQEVLTLTTKTLVRRRPRREE